MTPPPSTDYYIPVVRLVWRGPLRWLMLQFLKLNKNGEAECFAYLPSLSRKRTITDSFIKRTLATGFLSVIIVLCLNPEKKRHISREICLHVCKLLQGGVGSSAQLSLRLSESLPKIKDGVDGGWGGGVGRGPGTPPPYYFLSHLNPCRNALHGRAVCTLSLKCAMRWM